MKQRRFNIGPGAASLILIIVVLSLSVVGILSMVSVRVDMNISRRSLSVAEEIYALNESAEEALLRLDERLARCGAEANSEDEYLKLVYESLDDDMTLENGRVFWIQTGVNGRALECQAVVNGWKAVPRVYWGAHRLCVEIDHDEMDELWN